MMKQEHGLIVHRRRRFDAFRRSFSREDAQTLVTCCELGREQRCALEQGEMPPRQSVRCNYSNCLLEVV